MAPTRVEKWLEQLPALDVSDVRNGYYVVDGSFEGVPRLLLRIYLGAAQGEADYVIRVHAAGDTDGSAYVSDDAKVLESEFRWGADLRSAIGLGDFSGGQESLPDNFDLSMVVGKAELL